MNPHVYQIYYKKELLPGLDPDFIPYDNTENARPDLREWHVWDKIYRSEAKNLDLWGAVSPKFYEKTGVLGSSFIDFIKSSPGKDIYFICPNWRNMHPSMNVWINGEHYHPGLISLTNDIFRALGYSIDVSHLTMPTYFFCNYIVANKKFWNDYMNFIYKIFEVCRNDSDLNHRLLTSGLSNYLEDRTAPMFPFFIERLTPTFVLLGGYNSHSYSTTLNAKK